MEIVIWLGFCAAVGYYANSKGRSAILWGLLAFVISPLLAGLALALMKDKDTQQDISQLRMNQQMMHDRISSNEKMRLNHFSCGMASSQWRLMSMSFKKKYSSSG